MVVAACGNDSEKARFIKSLNEWIVSSEVNNPTYLVNVYKEVGFKLIEGIYCFENSEFDGVVEAIYPLRASFIQSGGSRTQRDLLNLMLIYSALSSVKVKNREIGEFLLRERLMLNPNSCLTKRMAQRFKLDEDKLEEKSLCYLI